MRAIALIFLKLQFPPTNEHEEPRFLSEPPPYPVICGPEAEKHGIRNNLMTHFVSMSEDGPGFGVVMDFDASYRGAL